MFLFDAVSSIAFEIAAFYAHAASARASDFSRAACCASIFEINQASRSCSYIAMPIDAHDGPLCSALNIAFCCFASGDNNAATVSVSGAA